MTFEEARAIAVAAYRLEDKLISKRSWNLYLDQFDKDGNLRADLLASLKVRDPSGPKGIMGHPGCRGIPGCGPDGTDFFDEFAGVLQSFLCEKKLLSASKELAPEFQSLLPFIIAVMARPSES